MYLESYIPSFEGLRSMMTSFFKPQASRPKNSFLEEIEKLSARMHLAYLKNSHMQKVDSSLKRRRRRQVDSNEQNPDRAFFWKPHALPVDAAMRKMWQNAKKAIEEHIQKAPGAFASVCNALPSLEVLVGPKNCSSLKFEQFAAEAQGPRAAMEDAHFFQEMEQGVIVGVLDGHGGGQVSKFASKEFQKRFSEVFSETQGNVRQTFELLIDEIHKKVAKHAAWNNVGSTAVICYIDKQNHLIYTATLGDSEANIYRKMEGELKSIPLSCVRDWSSKKDAQRAAVSLEIPQIATEWPNAENPKRLRYPAPNYGLNVSRSIGDFYYTGSEEMPGVIHKPKITVNQLQAGDMLILACDGLKDYVPETEIIQNLKDERDPTNKLVYYALFKKSAHDNVTVVAVKVMTKDIVPGHQAKEQAYS